MLGIVLVFAGAEFVRAFGLTVKNPNADDPSLGASLGLLIASVGGPLLTIALLVTSYRRFRDVPAAQEQRVRRPFDAWLLPGLVDALNVVIAVGATLLGQT